MKNGNNDTYTCVADLNRMRSQFNRGGGAICLKSQPTWSTFSHSAEIIDSCPIMRFN